MSDDQERELVRAFLAGYAQAIADFRTYAAPPPRRRRWWWWALLA